jgi:hypothetical protein
MVAPTPGLKIRGIELARRISTCDRQELAQLRLEERIARSCNVVALPAVTRYASGMNRGQVVLGSSGMPGAGEMSALCDSRALAREASRAAVSGWMAGCVLTFELTPIEILSLDIPTVTC